MKKYLLAGMLLLLCMMHNVVLARPATNTANTAAHAAEPPAAEWAMQETAIMGAAEATQEQLVAFIKARNAQPKLSCSVEELVAAYFREGAAEGIRGDIALCQALKETGFFRYGGHVKPQQNNYCGLGTTGGGVHGASFTTPERGARAHIQHLLAYASTERPHQAIVDPRYELVRKAHPDYAGMLNSWKDLNGRWAIPGKNYGESIVQMWEQAMSDATVNAQLEKEYTRRIAKGDAEASLSRGKLYAQQKQYSKALADYQKAAEYAPLKAEALLYEGLLYEAIGDAAKAGQAYDRALAENKRSAVALACLNNFRKRSVLPQAASRAEKPKHERTGAETRRKK